MYQVYDYLLVMGWDQKKDWALLGKSKLSWVFLTSLYFLLLTWLLKFSRLFFKSWAWVIQKSSAHYIWLIVDVSNSNALKWGMNTRVWHMSLTCRSFFFSLWHLTLTQDDTWDSPSLSSTAKKPPMCVQPCPLTNSLEVSRLVSTLRVGSKQINSNVGFILHFW